MPQTGDNTPNPLDEFDLGSDDRDTVSLRGTCKTCGFAANDMYWEGDKADAERAVKAIESKHHENPEGSECEGKIEFSTF